jgi:hypothetical protein
MAGTGITAINSLTGAAQTMVTGTDSSDFKIVSTGTSHKFNLPTASATNRGALSSANWTIFNNKIGAGDTATMLTPYLRSNIASATYLAKSDSSTYYTKYRSDTSRINIYSAINGKQSTLTNPVTGTGTNNQIAYFNSTGSTIASLATGTYPSLTELSYVKGTTSAVQTQIDNKFTTPTGWTNYLSSSTIVGVSSPTGSINYIVMGKLLFIQFDIQGTSSGTTFSFTIPYTTSATPQFSFGRGINGTTTNISLGIYNGGSTNVMTLLNNSSNVTTQPAWSSTGQKLAQGFMILNIN